MRFICGITSILCVFLLIPPAYSLSFKTLKVFKLSAADQSAVVRVEDGALKLVTVGQALDPYGKITAIGQDRIIFERIGVQGKEIYILRVEDNRQQIQKITRAAGHETTLKRPAQQKPVKR